jgi:hypothetical protein
VNGHSIDPSDWYVLSQALSLVWCGFMRARRHG